MGHPIPSVTDTSRAVLDGALLVLLSTLAAVALVGGRPQDGLAVLAVIPGLLILRILRVTSYLPRTKIGWLYVAIAIVITCAPFLGRAGTVARVAAALACIPVLLAIPPEERRPLPKPVGVGMALLVLALVASAMAAPSLGFGAARLTNWLMFVPLLFLTYYRPNAPALAFTAIIAGCIQMCGVLLQSAGIVGGTWGGILTSGSVYDPTRRNWLTRYTGFLLNPNDLAMVLAVSMTVAAMCLFLQVPARLKASCIILLVAFSYGIVTTGSRGGLIAAGIGVGLVFMFSGARGMAAAVAAMATLASYIQSSNWQGMSLLLQSLGQILGGSDRSALQRSSVWVERIGSSDLKSLILGHGFGGYVPGMFSRQSGIDIDRELLRRATVDNGWLKLVLESGFVGLAGMSLVILATIAIGLFRTRNMSNRALGIVGAAVLITIVWRALSVDLLDLNPWNAIIYMAVGATLAAARPDEATG